VTAVAEWTFDAGALLVLADARTADYREAVPFPHVVLDGLFPDAELDEVADGFPPPGDAGWLRHDDPRQRKLQWADPATAPPAPRRVITVLQSGPFLDFLERLTATTGLVGDPHCFQGGLHQIEPGGYLKVHADQDLQPRLGLRRRINLIVYLDRDWDEAWGGDLELWDAGMTACAARITPRFNRTVIFSTGPHANHGHPEPTASPPGVNRRSIALYYYSSPLDPASLPPVELQHATFRERPGEHVAEPGPTGWRKLAADVVPPVLVRALRRRRG
jgi:hypothetical protein